MSQSVAAGITNATVKRWVTEARRLLRSPGGEVSVAFVSPRVSRSHNRRYRRHDRPTNVLSFSHQGSQPSSGAERLWGELILCPAVIRREARQQARPYRAYTKFLIQHGLIHLLGLDHATRAEQGRWEKLEQKLLNAHV